MAGNMDFLDLIPRMIGLVSDSAIEKVAQLEVIDSAPLTRLNEFDILYNKRNTVH
jgi:hypothetical protein